MATLTKAFVDELAPAQVEQAQTMLDLEAKLRDVVARGAKAWPTVTVSASAVAAHLGRCVPEDGDLNGFFGSLAAEDLYLAFACAQQNPAGLAEMERRYGRQIDGALSMLKHEYLSTDDLRQIVRNKLYVATETLPAAISRYNGLGTLGGWLRVLATRAGLNAVRTRGGAAALVPDPAALEPVLADPELDYLKATYREAFKEAFCNAVEGLSARDRTLLRQSLIHKLTVREIGRMYSVHYATASRWIADARRALADATRGQLAQRLGLSQEQLDSIMRLIESRIDVSFVRVLG